MTESKRKPLSLSMPGVKPLRPVTTAAAAMKGTLAAPRQIAVAQQIMARSDPEAREAEAAPLPYGLSVDEVARLGGQFMTWEQIAQLKHIPPAVMVDCLARFPALRHAYEGGAAGALDIATRRLAEAVEAGDLTAIRFLLERKGGWTAPRDAPVVVVQGSGLTIDGVHVGDLADSQRLLRHVPDAELM